LRQKRPFPQGRFLYDRDMPSFPNKEAALAGRISLAKSEATGCARADREGHGVDSTCEFDQHAVARHPAEVARVRQVGALTSN
jgi:hypothetical protein